MKRYQYYSKEGIKWTNWFPLFKGAKRPKWQMQNKLLNQYDNNSNDSCNSDIDNNVNTRLQRNEEMNK